MESQNWSNLPLDILVSTLERLSFVDFHRSKTVCSHWYSCSKQTLPRKTETPWLMLFPEDGGCALFNPDEDRVYRTPRDFSGIRLVANSGKWLLVLDSLSNLYIIDVFSGKRIVLPPLESFVSGTSSLKRVDDREFRWEFTNEKGQVHVTKTFSSTLKGRLWVDEKAKEMSLVWYFDLPGFHLWFYKNGDTGYTVIPLREDSIPWWFKGFSDLVLRGYRLYIFSPCEFVRVIDFSGQQGHFEDVSESNPTRMVAYILSFYSGIAVTTTGEVLLVESTTFQGRRIFLLFKKDPNADPDSSLLEVVSLGDEALLLDFGISVPANHTLGIKPNSIYFTRYEGAKRIFSGLNIGVFNLATDPASDTHTRFPALASMSLKDARWFLPLS